AGQEQLSGRGKPLRTQIERDDTGSLIFWGPPGTGKTTLAQIIAHLTKPTSSNSLQYWPVSRKSSRSWRTLSGRASTARAQSSLSMKYTASTKHSRMHFFRTWKKATSG